MEGVGHVEVYKDLEPGSFGQLVLNDRDRILRDRDVLIDLPVITTKAYEW